MIRRVALLFLLGSGLVGCAVPPMPRMAMPHLSLPDLDVLGGPAPAEPTQSYRLSATEIGDIKTQFATAFADGRRLQFGPVTARLRANGSLLVCGLVNIEDRTGRFPGMRLFDGSAAPGLPGGRLAFTPRRVSGATSSAFDLYSACHDAGAF